MVSKKHDVRFKQHVGIENFPVNMLEMVEIADTCMIHDLSDHGSGSSHPVLPHLTLFAIQYCTWICWRYTLLKVYVHGFNSFFYIIARFHDFGSYIWAKLQKIKNLSFRKCRQVHVALIENQQNLKSHCYLSMFPRIKRHFYVSIFGHSILRVKPSKNLIKSPWDHLKKHTFFPPWKFLESPEKTMIESMIES